jgi:hypothetical protein
VKILCKVCRQSFPAERRSARFCGDRCCMKHHRNPTAYRRKIVTLGAANVTPGLRVVPLTLTEANAAVAQWHRHHVPAVGHRFSIGAMRGDEIVGAAIISRPVARQYDAGQVAEVTRLVTDGTPHVASNYRISIRMEIEETTCDSGQNTLCPFYLKQEGQQAKKWFTPPLPTVELRQRCYPRVKEFKRWHNYNVRRAAERLCDRVGYRNRKKGLAILWRPRPGLTKYERWRISKGM